MRGRLVEVARLEPESRDGMFRLFGTHFEGVSRAVFDRDLDAKNFVILIEDEAGAEGGPGALKGFSTLLVYETRLRGETDTVVYSGDTIVDPTAWSSSVLSRAWIASVLRLRERFPSGRLWWLLISSGFRTYRFLPTFWCEFWPRHDAATPEAVAHLLDGLARERFGEAYDPAAGVVRFPSPQVLREGLNGIPEERLKDPHIAFFATRNPGCTRGDELVCLTEIREDNLTRAGRRMWFAGEKV